MRVEPSILRKLNERRVLNTIRTEKTLSRADIQRKLNMTMPTVSKIIDKLLTQGWVLEVGMGESTMGRPPVMLEINPRATAIAIGIDLSRTMIRIVCVNLLAEVIFEREISNQIVDSVDNLLLQIELTLSDAAISPADVIGIGLAAPGSRNPHPDAPQRIGALDQIVSHHWHKEALEERIGERFAVPTWTENDANAAVLGEMWFGSVQGSRHLVFILADEGLGAGIAVNGSIYTGENNVAGEFSHMIVDMYGSVECECGRRGCIGGFAHMGGIRAGLKRLDLTPTADLAQEFERAKCHQEPEASIVSRTLDYLSTGIFNLLQVIDPSVVILGGGLFQKCPFAVEEVQQRLQVLVSPLHIPVRASTFGFNTVAIGAATLVLQHIYDHTKLVRLSEESPQTR